MSSTTGVTLEMRGLNCSAPDIVAAMVTETDTVHILSPPGIGDFAWVWSKFQNYKDHPIRWWFPSSYPRRVDTYCQLMGISYGWIDDLFTDWILRFDGEPKEHDLEPGKMYAVQINRHLEEGNPLENWCPWLPYSNPAPRLGHYPKGDWVTVYMASAHYSEGNLPPEAWATIIRDIESSVGPVRIVAAAWDMTLAFQVTNLHNPSGTPCYAQPLAECLKVMAGGRAVVGLNGGITILSTYLGVPTLEAYPGWLTGLAKAWPTPDVLPYRHWCYVKELPERCQPFLCQTLASG